MDKCEEKKTATHAGEWTERAGHLWVRRGVLTSLGWGGVAVCSCAAIGALARFGYPRVLFEPPTAFKAGFPDDYQVGEVSTRWIPTHRVWIVREAKGFYGLFASCTHLGCTPGWLSAEQKFKCFCHGSGFHKDGANFEGPAPRPLERVNIVLADDGQLIVDTGVRYRAEKGEWDRPGAFLKL
ncbi:MAG TPA: Rieske 2Fe-2S domain-containing protein [bacterium]|nr:Rieske 2Fe-2S domain-containing protein [bacterium]